MQRPHTQQSHAMTILLVKMFKGQADCRLDEHALRDLGLSRFEIDYVEDESDLTTKKR